MKSYTFLNNIMHYKSNWFKTGHKKNGETFNLSLNYILVIGLVALIDDVPFISRGNDIEFII